MAIYGLNFNGQEIPPGVRAKFKAKFKPEGAKRGEWAILQGVAQSEQEKHEMVLQAGRPGRRIFTLAKQTAAGTWWGFYIL